MLGVDTSEGELLRLFKGESDNVTIAASTTSANSALAGDGDALSVWNPTNNLAYLKSGVGAQVATASNGELVPPGMSVIACSPRDTDVAVLLSSGSGTFVIRRGRGI
jgi:hypothetical protein